MAKFKQNNLNNKRVMGNQTIGDARNILHAKSRKQMLATDARTKLAKLAKGTDARQKLEKIRNLKEGKFDVKKTKKGGITIVTTTQGQIQLTTKKKSQDGSGAQVNRDKVSKIGRNLTKNVNQTGKIFLSTKSVSSVNQYLNPNKNTAVRVGKTTSAKNQQTKNLQVIVKQPMSRAARLDEELINTHVDPVLMKRTIRQSARDRPRSPLGERLTARYRSRSRSPINSNSRNYYPEMQKSRIHYDDPRREALEAELIRQKIREDDRRRQSEPPPLHLTSGAMVKSSPLETKVVVSNLVSTVSQEDLNELFGDVGQLRRVKMSQPPGSAEIVFLSAEDADRAIEVYNNRQLDGKAMKCQLVTIGSPPKSLSGPKLSLPAQSSRQRRSYEEERIQEPTDTTSAVHRALFGDRKRPSRGMGSNPSWGGPTSTSPRTSRSDAPQKFTVTMRSSHSRQGRR